ncbi:MAG: carbohydrate ABC transporter permease [Chloroflexi bacterium]|nr:carbohydrate ABC transporter permease [Chloroflexota bacterium]MCL5275078.1 carbohydrate ABC transporter permease [Chloroflexota bacterium]
MSSATITDTQGKAPVKRKRTPLTPGMVVGKASSIIIQVFMWLFFISVVFPMLWTLITSLKTSAELFQSPWALPVIPQWDNYVRAWTKINVGTYIFNSVFVSATSLFFIMMLGAMVAYALARYEFRGNRVIYFYFISAMMIPGFLGFIPAWFLLRDLGILGTHLGLIVMYTSGSLPFTIFFLQAFFKTLPRELEEAAIIDGANLYVVFFRVMLPLATSGMLTIGIFNFLGVWNEYFWALITISDDKLKTLPLGMANLYEIAHYATDWGAMFAGFIIMLVPTFIVYAIFQNRLAEGITVGALKG